VNGEGTTKHTKATKGDTARPGSAGVPPAKSSMMLTPNPFEPLPPESLARIYEWPEEALRFLAGEGDCLHIVGECGMGKTALLGQIRHRLGHEGIEAPYTCVPLDRRFGVEGIEFGPVTLIDETDRLPKRVLGELLGKTKVLNVRIVLASHRNQLRTIHRAGLRTLHLALKPLTSTEEVARVFSDRVILAAGDDHPFTLAVGARDALLSHSGGNIERCLQLGYEVFEDLDRPRPITAADIDAAAASLARALA